ncbi:phosphoglyceromutase [Corynebacterium maris DSM 45190]|uniref:2,3-bisphosphoglycerate-dependent phosphoglycerate mutase n=1 Tax=Corynebacterium maris DSM 45190 TaxID=1224163 RepID=S5SRZ3_9CORY|nr:phosphoglyceromutase [Corynebacterium maris]AGS33894.1 phosphoglyceromutase [Corynebacterium maris DSM 45190]
MTNGKLILVRHGQSTWNKSNQFTGWVDVDLTEQGVAEAVNAGKLLQEKDVLPDVVYTSLLRRAIRTANITLNAADRHWIPVVRNWRLNERHYGKLQGLDKAQIREEFGEEQFMIWRRSYGTPPPEIDPDNEYSQTGDPRYFNLPEVPRTECLKDVVERFVPYFTDNILPRAQKGENVMLAAHGNSLRALVKYLDDISDDEIAGLNIPTGMPLIYEIAADGSVVNPGGTYLDPEAAEAGAAAVASQGSKQ